jgi:hypothetical protein
MINLTVRFVLSQFTFILSNDSLSLRFFFLEKLSAQYEFFSCCQISWLASPSAPAARSAASGPAPVSTPGRGRPRLSLLASSLLVAASSPAQLASRVRVAALIGWQLAGQPERGRHRLGLRWRRGLRRFGRQGGVDLTGITDSSLARLLAGSAVSPPMTYAIIFPAATLVAFEVRCTPSPAQMLVPSTVVSSCKGDSSGPKNSNTFRILASAVLLPAAAASDKNFSDPDIYFS